MMNWALNYDHTLKNWNYKAPVKAANKLIKIKDKISSNLDLACGTGMFAKELKKKYPNIVIDGCDISSQSLKIAKLKNFIEIYSKRVLKKKLKSPKNMIQLA